MLEGERLNVDNIIKYLHPWARFIVFDIVSFFGSGEM